MIEAAKFYFKGEGLPSKGKLKRRIYLSLTVIGVMTVIISYFLYLKHITHPWAAAARRNADAAAAKTLEKAKEHEAFLLAIHGGHLGATNIGQVPNHAGVSLGDSLMSVLTPSASAETMQLGMQSMKPTDKSSPVALPASRQALRIQTAGRRELPALTGEQKLWACAQASFDNAIDLATKNPDIYGFAGDDQILEATLGKPIRVYTIAADDRRNYQSGQPVKPLLQATNEWIFPVILNHQVRFMLPVKRQGDEYVAEASSRALAMVYQKIMQRWPASEGYHPELVVNPYIANYYFTIPELPDQNLTDTSVMFQYNPTLSPATVILASWR